MTCKYVGWEMIDRVFTAHEMTGYVVVVKEIRSI
jgi:hypothetical protein